MKPGDTRAYRQKRINAWMAWWQARNPNASLLAIWKQRRYFKRRDGEGWTIPKPPLDDAQAFHLALRNEFRDGPKQRRCPMTEADLARLATAGVTVYANGTTGSPDRVITPFGDLIIR